VGPLTTSQRILAEIRGFPGFQVQTGAMATRDDLGLVHTQRYVDTMLAGNIPKVRYRHVKNLLFYLVFLTQHDIRVVTMTTLIWLL